MAKSMGGDLVLQLLHEFRESQEDYKHFKHEMLEFKRDYLGFKQDMLGFKGDMLSFRDVMEVRMDLMQQSNVQTLGYLKHIVKMLQSMTEQVDDTRQRVSTHDEQLGDHEQRLTKLERK
jgi:hypothetical protein